jgi:hypothetical protein
MRNIWIDHGPMPCTSDSARASAGAGIEISRARSSDRSSARRARSRIARILGPERPADRSRASGKAPTAPGVGLPARNSAHTRSKIVRAAAPASCW